MRAQFRPLGQLSCLGVPHLKVLCPFVLFPRFSGFLLTLAGHGVLFIHSMLVWNLHLVCTSRPVLSKAHSVAAGAAAALVATAWSFVVCVPPPVPRVMRTLAWFLSNAGPFP